LLTHFLIHGRGNVSYLKAAFQLNGYRSGNNIKARINNMLERLFIAFKALAIFGSGSFDGTDDSALEPNIHYDKKIVKTSNQNKIHLQASK